VLQETNDTDPVETREWLDSVDAVVASDGRQRMGELLDTVVDHAQDLGVSVGAGVSTPYVNTILPEDEPELPGDPELERLATALVRWNAIAIVLQANAESTELGGHIASYQSAETLYEVGFNHFWRARSDAHLGDLVYLQGHSSPGFYARAFLEGRLSEEELRRFRQEVGGGGLSSYPHPWLMPGFWQFPTVSMGLGPLMAIYQARFMKYLDARGIVAAGDRKVWAFMGDGEMDEPESMGAISLAGREHLDNLVFVINCNLQRLDGPVRGNGKIVQELESVFRGAGWNVVKCLWGKQWDDLLARDTDGVLVGALNALSDGEQQTLKARGGAYLRENFFGRDPRLLRLVDDVPDERLARLRRGGHDHSKVYAAYDLATRTVGQPTVVLAHTVKGWTLGSGFENRNAVHQMKKLDTAALAEFRDRLELDVPDASLAGPLPPYLHPGRDSEEIRYLLERRATLGGAVPSRRVLASGLDLPAPSTYDAVKKGSTQPVATTMAFVRLLKDLLRDKGIGHRIVPIVPDEARTFGMDSLFPTAKIYSPHGQRYDAVDSDLVLSYKESTAGQLLNEGISEAGAMASFVAAATSYATHGEAMIPVYVFYSMFGWQRTGDQMWQLADQLGRGFLLGATAGRTTLNGEGLQHQDGHSQLIASTNPACVSYDPAYGYEVAHIVEDGLRRMYGDSPEDVFYYLTVYNDPYPQPAEPAGVREGVLRGMYLLSPAANAQATILASGPIVPIALEAASRLEAEGVPVEVRSVTSWNELRRDALAGGSWVASQLAGCAGPVIAVSDWMRAVPDQIAPWVTRPWHSLGTDGFGRSDTRAALRAHFGIDADAIVRSTLEALS
jgi:pyruvate dehydrogenase E1 component